MAEECPEEEVLSHLAHRPSYILKGAIALHGPVAPALSSFQRTFKSSIGRLDNLPVELLHETLNYLDLRSLCFLSRASVRGKAIVESLPAYRDVLSHAGHVLHTLSRTKVIGMHSVARLHSALCTDRCASCGNYGAFLFLLSADRCCFACLLMNQSLWMIPPTLARDCFDLTKHDSKALPILRSIPGVYSVRNKISRKRPILLTSVGAAKELALRVHGSTKALENISAAKQSHMSIQNFRKYTRLVAAPLEPLSQDPLTLDHTSNIPQDEFNGMGHVPYPSMSKCGTVENGLWCRGCERTFEIYRSRGLDQAVISSMVPHGANITFQYIMGMQYRARSRSEFLEHAKQCHSAKEVLAKRWVGLL